MKRKNKMNRPDNEPRWQTEACLLMLPPSNLYNQLPDSWEVSGAEKGSLHREGCQPCTL